MNAIDTRAIRAPRAREGTVCIKPWKRAGDRQVTRAHPRLSREPGFGASLASTLAPIALRLRTLLGVHVGLEATLLDHSVMPTALLPRQATWAGLNLAASGTAAVL